MKGLVLLACLLYAAAAFAFRDGAIITLSTDANPPIYINKPDLNTHFVMMVVNIENDGLPIGQTAYVVIKREMSPPSPPFAPIYEIGTGQVYYNGRIPFTGGQTMQRALMVPIPQGRGTFQYFACEWPGGAHQSSYVNIQVINLTVDKIEIEGLSIWKQTSLDQSYKYNEQEDKVGSVYERTIDALQPLCLKTEEKPSNVTIEFLVNADVSPPQLVNEPIPIEVSLSLIDYGIDEDENDHNNGYLFAGIVYAQPMYPEGPMNKVRVTLDPIGFPTIRNEIRGNSYGIELRVDDYHWVTPDGLMHQVEIFNKTSSLDRGEYFAIGEPLTGAGTLTLKRLRKIAPPCHNIHQNFDTAVPLKLLGGMGAKGIPTSQNTIITVPNDAWGVLDDTSTANAEDILKCLDQMCCLIGYGNLFEGDNQWYFYPNENGTWRTNQLLGDYTTTPCSTHGTDVVGFDSELWGAGWYARIPALGGYTNGAYRYLVPGCVYWNSIGDVGNVFSDTIGWAYIVDGPYVCEPCP